MTRRRHRDPVHFVNQYGILVVALVSMLVVAWVLRALAGLSGHLNVHGRPRVGTGWRLLTSAVAPAGSAIVLVLGWLLVVALPVVGFLLARLPWRAGTPLDGPPPGSDPAGPLEATAMTGSDRPLAGHEERGPR